MWQQSLTSKLITGGMIALSLGTSGVAGYKVFANRGSDLTVPEVGTPTPTPAASQTSAGAGLVMDAQADEQTMVTQEGNLEAGEVMPEVVGEVLPSPSIPSMAPQPSNFPVAPMISGGQFDDDGDEDELESEDSDHDREEKPEEREHENQEQDED